MRGEKNEQEYADFTKPGSPPHARGKVRGEEDKPGSPRITPAYAGKRWTWAAIWSTPQDHPPHTRGKVVVDRHVEIRLGITPAYAGKRLRKPRKINVPAVPHFGFHLVSQTRKRS